MLAQALEIYQTENKKAEIRAIFTDAERIAAQLTNGTDSSPNCSAISKRRHIYFAEQRYNQKNPAEFSLWGLAVSISIMIGRPCMARHTVRLTSFINSHTSIPFVGIPNLYSQGINFCVSWVAHRSYANLTSVYTPPRLRNIPNITRCGGEPTQ